MRKPRLFIFKHDKSLTVQRWLRRFKDGNTTVYIIKDLVAYIQGCPVYQFMGVTNYRDIADDLVALKYPAGYVAPYQASIVRLMI